MSAAEIQALGEILGSVGLFIFVMYFFCGDAVRATISAWRSGSDKKLAGEVQALRKEVADLRKGVADHDGRLEAVETVFINKTVAALTHEEPVLVETLVGPGRKRKDPLRVA